jgi:hypothetical protein
VDEIIEIAVVGVATVTVKPDGAGIAQERGRKQLFGVTPRAPGESVWRVVERVARVLARSDEIGG